MRVSDRQFDTRHAPLGPIRSELMRPEIESAPEPRSKFMRSPTRPSSTRPLIDLLPAVSAASRSRKLPSTEIATDFERSLPIIALQLTWKQIDAFVNDRQLWLSCFFHSNWSNRKTQLRFNMFIWQSYFTYSGSKQIFISKLGLFLATSYKQRNVIFNACFVLKEAAI